MRDGTRVKNNAKRPQANGHVQKRTTGCSHKTGIIFIWQGEIHVPKPSSQDGTLSSPFNLT